MAIIARGSSSVNASPCDFIPALALAADCWAAARMARLAAIDAERALHHEDASHLRGEPPAEIGDIDRLDVLAADLDYDTAFPRGEWWADLATETVADHYGVVPPASSALEPSLDYDADYRSRSLYEDAVVGHHLRGRRSGSTRVDAEEEARNVYGWGR